MGQFKVVLYGPGAIGLALAAELEEIGFAVRFVGRRGPVAVTASLEKGGQTRSFKFAKPDAVWLRDVALALVTVKAFDLEGALDGAITAVGPGVPVLSLANGAVEVLVRASAGRHPQAKLRLGFCTFGVSEKAPGRFAVMSEAGEVSFGPISQEDEPPTTVERELVERSQLFVWHRNILPLARRKWIFNVVINTLTAAKGLKRNGDLLADLPTLAAAFSEACALAVELWGSLPLPKAELWKGLEQLIEKTAANENSMARDVRLGRQTEAAFLVGLAKDPAKYPILTRYAASLVKAGR